jgi:hypothetical protein
MGSKCVCSAWEVHVVRRHVEAQTGNQNERTASSGRAKDVEKGRYRDVGGENTLGGEAAGVEVVGW